MIDVRVESIIYQSQIYYRDLVNELVDKRKLGKALDYKWEKADLILGYLEALNYRDRLTDEDDINDVNFILECLIKLCELNQYPVSAPIEFQEPPAVIVGEPGEPGEQGNTGAQGPAGLATDFQVSLISVPTVVDSFDIDDAKAARWDYYLVESSGEQRAGSIIGHWLPDGSALELVDTSADDLGTGSTDQLEFSLEFLGGNIRLIATPASGIWSVIGSRYFIPNNGNGSGPISDVLPNGQVYIGNASNIAQARAVSGVINITNTGITSFVAGAIQNADINATAGIARTKLAASTANTVAIYDASGFLISSAVSAATLAFLDATSSVQNQLNSKLTDPMTTIGDMIIRNGLNITSRLGAGVNGQVLTMAGGLPTWSAAPGGISGLTTGFLPKASSAISLADSIISETTGAILIAGTTEIQGGFRTQASGSYFKVKVINIGNWDMASSSTTTVAHGIVDYTKIRDIRIIIFRDDGTTPLFLDSIPSLLLSSVPATIRWANGSFTWDATNINLSRESYTFIGTDYNDGSVNRGYITILYEA